MEPHHSGTDDQVPHQLQTDGDSVPWTPQEILADVHAELTQAAHAGVPFVVQFGSMLFMVGADDCGWTLAELEFHPRYCIFQEKRRATYTWPREAFGAMLSRLAGVDVDADAIANLTSEFSDWLSVRFSRASRSRSVTC